MVARLRSSLSTPICKWSKKSWTLRWDKTFSFSKNWNSLILKRTLVLFHRQMVILRLQGRLWSKKISINKAAPTNKVLQNLSLYLHLKWSRWTNRNNISNIRSHHNIRKILSDKIWAGRCKRLRSLQRSQLKWGLLFPSQSSIEFNNI